MKKFCLCTFLIVLFFNLTANCAVNDDYFKNANKIENYIIAQNNMEIFQNYILFCKKPVKKITSEDNTIAHAYIMTTIDNERNTVIIEAHSTGSTKLNAIVDNQVIVINVTVKKNKTIVETDSDLFEIISLDIPSSVNITEGA